MISNSSAGGVSLAGPIDVYRSLTFGISGKNLNTNDQLTLKSSATETAWVGDLTGKTINGNVTVERYINIGTAPGQHEKAWEFLATPTTGQTVYDSWMEKGQPTEGFGTQITGPEGISGGFDMQSPSPSMKYYDAATSGSWKGITNTSQPLYNDKGYMLFVRGDRSVSGVAGNTLPKPTVLRSTGKLITGPLNINVPANSFASIGNPYASAIDMRTVLSTKTWANDDFFTVWNSNRAGAYGYGIYETYVRSGTDYYSVPGDGTTVNNFIQSGQAFFVQSTGAGGSFRFTEAAKAPGSKNVFFRPQGTSGRNSQLRTNLYALKDDGSKILADGTLQQFSDDYSNDIDGLDGRKLFNSSENLSIRVAGKDLIVERKRMLDESDTIFYNLTGMRAQNYRFEFTATDLAANGLQGFLEDIYLRTLIPLNMAGETSIDFSVTNVAASYAPNRFRVVFKKMNVLPVTMVSVNAYQKNNDVVVEWKVVNESNMQQYEVEESNDGRRFVKVATINAYNTGAVSYNWTDQHILPGYNYYRIRSVGLDGKATYTATVKVLINDVAAGISIYPNPITNGIINLRFTNQPAGKYGLRLLNPLGQIIISRQIERAEGNNYETLKWDYNLAHGVYQLEITKPNGEVKLIKVMY